MELGLTKRKIEYYNPVYEARTIHEETIEMIVPDSSPDMVRIVSSNGYACVKDKSLHSKEVTVSGWVKGCVHYIAEGDSSIRKLDVNIPFSHEFEMQADAENAECVVGVKLTGIEGREINSRKIALRAHIAIELKVYSKKSMHLCCDIPESDKCGVETRKRMADVYIPVAVKEKSFTIIDDIEIPKTSPEFESILRQDIDICPGDIKLIGNKAIIKGVAKIKYLYNTKNGTVSASSHELPYSQIMDIETNEEDCELTAKVTMRAAEIEATHDISGDARYISVNILADACVTAYMKESIEMIDDLYSVSNTIEAEFEEITTSELSEHISRRIAVNESFETAIPVKRVLDTNVILEQGRIKDNKIINDLQLQVYYIGEDDGFYSTTRRCSAECNIAGAKDAECIMELIVNGETASAIGNEISVRCFIDYDVRVLEKNKLRSVSALNVGEKVSGTSSESSSVVVKFIYNDRELWDIAKENNTTVEEIAEANGLDASEKIAAGSMILIPLKA